MPSELSKCTQLGVSDVGFNSLNGFIPLSSRSWTGLSTLTLSENHFIGGIPPFLSEFEKLTVLELGGNLLGGQIPASIGAFENPFYLLNLSNDGLTGRLPSELLKLERLDTSINNLRGSLAALKDMVSLLEVNVSYNNFTSAVPETLMKLLQSSPMSFLGSSGLCVSCLASNGLTCKGNGILPPCDFLSCKRNGLSKVKIALISLGSIFLFVLFGLVFMFGLCKKRSKQAMKISAPEGASSLL